MVFGGRRRKATLQEACGDDVFPLPWRGILSRSFAPWATLTPAERTSLEDLTLELIAIKRWEAARGFTLNDEVIVTIAAHAALLVLALPAGIRLYGQVGPIIVHATSMVLNGPRPGPIPGSVVNTPLRVSGHTRHRGPVVLAWDAARREARSPRWGHNVVFHEFAHCLDLLDGEVDGIPVVDEAGRRRWHRVCEPLFEAIQRGEAGELLRSYAGVSRGEFFAVATEVFFTRPVDLAILQPDLYRLLSEFYRQNPARRLLTHATMTLTESPARMVP